MSRNLGSKFLLKLEMNNLYLEFIIPLWIHYLNIIEVSFVSWIYIDNLCYSTSARLYLISVLRFIMKDNNRLPPCNLFNWHESIHPLFNKTNSRITWDVLCFWASYSRRWKGALAWSYTGHLRQVFQNLLLWVTCKFSFLYEILMNLF